MANHVFSALTAKGRSFEISTYATLSLMIPAIGSLLFISEFVPTASASSCHVHDLNEGRGLAFSQVRSIAENTKLAAPQYDLGSGATCNNGFSPLTSSSQDCKDAADALGFQPDESSFAQDFGGSRPQGCFLADNGKVFFNTLQSPPHAAMGNDNIICENPAAANESGSGWEPDAAPPNSSPTPPPKGEHGSMEKGAVSNVTFTGTTDTPFEMDPVHYERAHSGFQKGETEWVTPLEDGSTRSLIVESLIDTENYSSAWGYCSTCKETSGHHLTWRIKCPKNGSTCHGVATIHHQGAPGKSLSQVKEDNTNTVDQFEAEMRERENRMLQMVERMNRISERVTGIVAKVDRTIGDVERAVDGMTVPPSAAALEAESSSTSSTLPHADLQTAATSINEEDDGRPVLQGIRYLKLGHGSQETAAAAALDSSLLLSQKKRSLDLDDSLAMKQCA